MAGGGGVGVGGGDHDGRGAVRGGRSDGDPGVLWEDLCAVGGVVGRERRGEGPCAERDRGEDGIGGRDGPGGGDGVGLDLRGGVDHHQERSLRGIAAGLCRVERHLMPRRAGVGVRRRDDHAGACGRGRSDGEVLDCVCHRHRVVEGRRRERRGQRARTDAQRAQPRVDIGARRSARALSGRWAQLHGVDALALVAGSRHSHRYQVCAVCDSGTLVPLGAPRVSALSLPTGVLSWPA